MNCRELIEHHELILGQHKDVADGRRRQEWRDDRNHARDGVEHREFRVGKRCVTYDSLGALRPMMSAGEPLDFDALYGEYCSYAEQLRPYVTETETLLQDAIRNGQRVLFEGAQGTFLDLDHGTYPYVTSSHPTAGGACLGTGIGPRSIDNVLGVCKAYTTRVGEGPFPTELLDATGEQIRYQGQEYGTTTGRPRRCGWLDLVSLRHSAAINSLSGLIITRLDVLAGVGRMKLAVGYQAHGQRTELMPINRGDWDSVRPVYEELDGWTEDLRSARSWEDLPVSVHGYIRTVEEFTGTPAAILSVGPDREETIILRPDLIWK